MNEDYQIINLEKIKIGVSQVIAGQAIADMRVNVTSNYINDTMTAHLTTWAMTESTKKKSYEFRFEYPKTWVEAFKKQYFPKWLLKKYPVKFAMHKEKVHFSAYEVYPQLPKVFPDCGHHFTEICVKED